MNNDLISREALKSALKSNCKPEICHDYGTNWCEACCPHNDFEDLIDNAPTVEPRIEYGTDGQPYKLSMTNGKEWIDYDNTFYKCPDCGYLLGKYCPQCQNKVILPKGGAEE